MKNNVSTKKKKKKRILEVRTHPNFGRFSPSKNISDQLNVLKLSVCIRSVLFTP